MRAGHPAEPGEGRDVTLEERLLALGAEGDVDRRARVGQAQLEHRDLRALAADVHVREAEVDLGLVARMVDGNDRDVDVIEVRARGGSLTTARRTVTSDMVAPSSSTRRSQIRRAVWRCLRGAAWSSVSQRAIVAACAPMAGLARSYDCRGGGTADSRACRTARRCTP